MVITTQNTKVKACQTCGVEKALTEFSGCGVTPDRFQPNCKPCHEQKKRAGRIAAGKKRVAQDTATRAEAESVVEVHAVEAGGAAGVAEIPEKSLANPVPYPGFEDLASGRHDERAFAKVMVNMMTQILNERTDHPKREEILEKIASETRIADMDDERFHAHQLYKANPLHKLTNEEKLHCIRSLPLPIVLKLFPHL